MRVPGAAAQVARAAQLRAGSGLRSVPRLLRACHSITVEASLPRSTGCSGRRSSARAPGHARRQLPAASPGHPRAASRSSQPASSSPRFGFYPELLGVVYRPLVSGCSVRFEALSDEVPGTRWRFTKLKVAESSHLAEGARGIGEWCPGVTGCRVTCRRVAQLSLRWKEQFVILLCKGRGWKPSERLKM